MPDDQVKIVPDFFPGGGSVNLYKYILKRHSSLRYPTNKRVSSFPDETLLFVGY
jgi:hypothetical protein